MITWLASLGRSFRFAARGLAWVVATQRNARIHLLAALVVATAGAWFRISAVEWCLVTAATGGVFAAEALNTAVEKLADRVTLEKDERIRDAKDAAAGAVLAVSIGAAVIGGIIFLPRVLAML